MTTEQTLADCDRRIALLQIARNMCPPKYYGMNEPSNPFARHINTMKRKRAQIINQLANERDDGEVRRIALARHPEEGR